MVVGLRQGCVMSPWMSNLFMDGAVKKWEVRIMNASVCLNERDERQFGVSSLSIAVDVVQTADSESA